MKPKESEIKDLENRLYKQKIILNGIGYFPDVKNIIFNTRTYVRLGAYFQKTKTIEISYNYYILYEAERLDDIILHELTHNLDHILNGKCDKRLDGHGDAWKIIIEDINKKLNTNISRYTHLYKKIEVNKINNTQPKKYNYIVKCKFCNHETTIRSKYSKFEKVKPKKCYLCNHLEYEFITSGQYGYDLKNNKRIIIPN